MAKFQSVFKAIQRAGGHQNEAPTDIKLKTLQYVKNEQGEYQETRMW